MPKYAKFPKVFSNRRKLEKKATLALSDSCWVILQKKILKKIKDPRGFVINYFIGDCVKRKAFVDSGTSINEMSYKLFLKLGLGEPTPAWMTLQLADRSVRHP